MDKAVAAPMAATGTDRPGPKASGDALVALAHQHDPIARRLTVGRRRGFWQAVGVWLALTLIVDLGTGAVLGSLTTTGPRIGLLNDPAGLLAEFLCFPLLMGYYLWAPPALLRAMRDLEIEGVVSIHADDLRWLRRLLTPRIAAVLLVGSISFAVALFLVFTVSPLRGLLWLGDPIFAMVKVPFWIAQTWAALSLIVSMVVLTQLLGRVFGARRKIAIEPLHPDGCGGLRPLSTFSLKLTVFIGLAGAAVLLAERTYIFANKLADQIYAIPVHVMAVVLVLGGMLFFFAPLMAPHRRMEAAKVEALHRVSDRFHNVEYRTLSQLATLKTEGFSTAARDLEAMRKIYDLIDGFPVWPFDIRIFRVFAVAVLGQPLLALTWDIFGGQIKRVFGAE